MPESLHPTDPPKLGKIPPSLRWGLIWAILRGEFLAIMMTAGDRGIQYQFVVEPKTVQRWLKQRDERRAKERDHG